MSSFYLGEFNRGYFDGVGVQHVHCGEWRNGALAGKEIDLCTEDELGDFVDPNKFQRSLRKVYWYRRLKNKSKG